MFESQQRTALPNPKGNFPMAKASTIVDRIPAERAEIYEARVAAANGKLPAEPDFSRPTHASYRNRLAAITAAIKAKDLKTLRADDTQPVSSSRVILCRYRDNAIAALEFRAKAAKRAKASAQKANWRAMKRAA